MSAPSAPARSERPLVRRARVDEWAALKELRLRALRTDPLAFGGTLAEEQALPDARWIERATRGATSPSEATWVAEERDRGLVGSAVLTEVDRQVHLFALWVDPRCRGVGLGGRLLDAALAWGEHAFPGRSVQLEANPRQAAALRLYETRGFRGTGARRPLGHTDGEWRVEMVRAPPRAALAEAPVPADVPRRAPNH